MITIEAYRASIGSFCPKAQRHTQLSELEDLSGAYKGYKFTNHNAEQIYFLKAFVAFLIVVILYLNMNLAIFKLLKLLLDGDIESNPGPWPCPYKLQKSIQGTFHQAHPKFGETSGIQCACNSLFAICWSSIKRVSIWKPWDLDYILEHGDALFKDNNILRPLSVEELPETVLINGHVLKVEMLSNVNRLLGASILFDKELFPGNGLIFTTNGYCFSLIWAKQNVFLFDSHSRNKEGSFVESGSSILLAFKSLSDVEKYIKTEYAKHISNFSDTQFDLQYIKITTESTSASSILSSVNKARNRIYKQKYDANEEIKKRNRDQYSDIIGTPKHDAIKKRKLDSSHDRYSAIIGTPQHIARKQQMQSYDRNVKSITSNSKQRILKFTKQIQEGPYYVCVVCNRCHYFRSVILFKQEKYDIDIDQFYYEVSSVDGLLYICGTCHKKLLKSEIPAQSVWNKLGIYLLLDDLANLNRLEKAIISRRILFKKITIMPKGQTPKLKGSICNVPIDTNDVTNILPRGADSNGIIMIKLKRKLSFRGHVYFEAVLPDLVNLALTYLKDNNHLYSDIVIDVSQIPSSLLSLTEPVDNSDHDVDDIGSQIDERENPLDAHRLGAHETTLISNMPQSEELTIAPGEGKQPMSILNDQYCEELAHPHLFPTGNFGYKIERNVKLSPDKRYLSQARTSEETGIHGTCSRN